MAGIAVEEIARGDFNCAHALEATGIAGGLLSRYGNEKICLQWLPNLISGEIAIATALTEAHCGSDAAALKTSARLAGDKYILDGDKSSISISEAQAAVVWARTSSDSKSRASGISTLIVPTDLPGITLNKMPDVGFRPVGRCQIFFDNVEVPAENLIGEEGKGFYQIMGIFDHTRVELALQSLAVAQVSLEETVEYVKERTTFGLPLARYEGISFQIAQDATLIEAARLLCYKTLWLADQGKPHTKEAAMCKWWSPKVAFDVIHHCLLMHGHYGYSAEMPFGQRMNDVMANELADGTEQIMKIIIAGEMLGKEFRPIR